MEEVAGAGLESLVNGDRMFESIPDIDPTKVVQIPIEQVCVRDSPRVAGEDALHVQALSEVGGRLPPILVHRQTMTVVDGVHRLRAAQRIGAKVIDAVYFDGDARETFVAAVRMNSTHGLPLSLPDRKAAAARILCDYPEWSNRRVAVVAGLSDKTIAVIRRGISAENPHRPKERMGRDGVMYPTGVGERRRLALAFLDANPEASAKEVASATGASLATAKRAQRAVRDGCATVAGRRKGSNTTVGEDGVHRTAPPDSHGKLKDPGIIIQRLRADPSLRFTENGRRLLRMLDIVPVEPTIWKSIVDSLPIHCALGVVELARQHSQNWQNLADSLAQRADSGRVSGATTHRVHGAQVDRPRVPPHRRDRPDVLRQDPGLASRR
ncbi:ParB N-terminal domain-containing protein [Nocardia sp. NPDC051570]|uniref:ParB/RepB/Spo0J family partition protein n=1 Tax=Nocardia sp. NPDC051570 TaxID=3364324 RepID=UPI00379D26EE